MCTRWVADPLRRSRPVYFLPKEISKTSKRFSRAALKKIYEAGCVILGGHSISEDEVKFGYAVTGRSIRSVS